MLVKGKAVMVAVERVVLAEKEEGESKDGFWELVNDPGGVEWALLLFREGFLRVLDMRLADRSLTICACA